MHTGFPWHALNRTELVQMSKHSGDVTAASIAHAELVSLMSCESEVTDPPAVNSIDQWRDALIRFVIDHWTTIQTQVSCPAKELGALVHLRTSSKRYPVPTGYACYKCPDVRVMSCVNTNTAQLDEIISRKDNTPATSRRSTRSIDMAFGANVRINLDTIPTDAATLATMGPFVQLGIARELGFIHLNGAQAQVPPFGGPPASVEESAFRKETPDTRAAWLSTALLMYKSKGGAPAQAVVPPTVAAPVSNVVPITQAMAPQVAQPVAPPPTRGRRQPVTTPQATEVAAGAPVQQAAAPSPDNAAILKFVSDVYSIMSSNSEVLKAVYNRVETLELELQAARSEILGLKSLAYTGMHVSATLGQSVFNVAPEDIIDESAKYAEQMMASAPGVLGKA